MHEQAVQSLPHMVHKRVRHLLKVHKRVRHLLKVHMCVILTLQIH